MKTHSELFRELLKQTRELGRAVTSDEFAKEQGVMAMNSFAFYYGSFDGAAKEALYQVRSEQQPRSDPTLPGKEEMPMSKKKSPQPSGADRELVLKEFVDMYITRDGMMPSERALKKNPYIRMEVLQTMRKNGELTEEKVRRLAEAKAGRKFVSAQERRYQRRSKQNSQEESVIEGATTIEVVEPPTEPMNEGDLASLELSATPEPMARVETSEVEQDLSQATDELELEMEHIQPEMAESKPEVKKMRGSRITEEEAIEDMRALARKLGRIPSVAEIKDHSNGAKYGYRIYVKYLGPKEDWVKVLGPEFQGMEKPTSARTRRTAKEATSVVPSETGNTPVAGSMNTLVEAGMDSQPIKVANVGGIPITITIPQGMKAKLTLIFDFDA